VAKLEMESKGPIRHSYPFFHLSRPKTRFQGVFMGWERDRPVFAPLFICVKFQRLVHFAQRYLRLFRSDSAS
jgi:hypothetical protein